MHFGRGVLAGSLGVAGLAAIVQAQAGSAGVGIEARPGVTARQRAARPMQPDTYGTSTVGYYNVDATDLVPYTNSIIYVNDAALVSNNCSGLCFVASIHVPSGAILQTIELDYYDNSTTDQVVASLSVCDYLGKGCFGPPDADCGFTACSGITDADGWSYRIFDISASNIQIDNYYARYYVRAGTTSNDVHTQLSRVQISYKLQVSPGPLTATFTDVPTNHPFFKFVEALHKAGITGGYPDGRFGVNDPITRGQMAVFLSTALGLQFP